MTFEAQIRKFSESNTTQEQCGLVLRDQQGILYATHERNVSENPEHQFAIDTQVHLNATQSGGLVGYWHSHNATHSLEHSPEDKAVADALGLPCWLWVHETQRLLCYVPEAARGDLIGRQFVPIVHDCVSLVWDYYKRVLGIELPHVERTLEDYGRGFQGNIRDLMEKAGARIVSGQPKRHDIILMGLHAPFVNHMGVYEGEGWMLHQTMNHTSERVPYGGYWERCTIALVRVADADKILPDSQAIRPLHEGLPQQTTT